MLLSDHLGGRRAVTVYAVLAAASVGGHLGYPAALALVTAGRSDPEPVAPEPWPSVTVIVAAYLESAVIAAKVADCYANQYPGQLDVLVVADDPETAAAARSAGAKVHESDGRRGKSLALSEGFEVADGEILVMTDANATLTPGSIANMVRWFGDPKVAAVAGEKRHSAGREGVYWAFESWLKRREARLGTTIALVGECSAIRRSVAPAIPEWVVVDDFWLAIAVRRAGGSVAYESGAAAIEAPAGAADEWQRRTRIIAGAIHMLRRERSALGVKDPVLAFEIWGHRLWRMTAGPAAHAGLIGYATNRALGRERGAGFARLVLLGHAAIAAGYLAGDLAPGPLRAAGQIGYLQVVGLGGIARSLTGSVAAKWPKSDREVSE